MTAEVKESWDLRILNEIMKRKHSLSESEVKFIFLSSFLKHLNEKDLITLIAVILIKIDETKTEQKKG